MPQFDFNDNSTLRKYAMNRKGALELERSSFIEHYRELAEFTQPRRGRFFTSDRNRGTKRHQSIINSAASRALRVARAGMFAGVMSPTRPWFKLETYDMNQMRSGQVREWLYFVERMLQNTFLQSNLYNMAPTLLGELLLFATGTMSHVDDDEDVARFYTHTAGSYMIAQDDKYRVNTFLREFEMTVDQMVSMFGLPNVSQTVKNHYDRSEYDKWMKVCQLIEPNPDYDPRMLDPTYKLFRSFYFEPSGVEEKILRRTGFDTFPVYCPRWETTAEDVYGTNCPGMEALGDIKGLQIMERRKSQAVDKIVNPPLTGPTQLKNSPVSSLPGGVTLYDSEPNNQLRPLYQIDPRVGELRLDIQAIEQRINQAFFVDLFMAITSMPGIQPKNQLELMQRHEERLLQLGPVLEQVHGEFLAPLVSRTFQQFIKRGMLPPAPQELQGQPLRIRFVSMLALAQRAVELQGLERFSGYVSNLAAVVPSALDKFNADEAVEYYGIMTGVMPSVWLDEKEVAEIRKARQQEELAMMQLQAQQVQADTNKSNAAAMKSGADADKAAIEAENLA